MSPLFSRFNPGVSADRRRPPPVRAMALYWMAVFALGLGLVLALAGRLLLCAPGSADNVIPAAAWTPPRHVPPNGATFGKPPIRPYAAPRAQVLNLPRFDDYSAIWGATGRDHRGHIWLGVTCKKDGWAHLYEYIPANDVFIDRGNVLDELTKLDLYENGMSQSKIHSRIVQSRDGNLYFTSMDEGGENESKQINPTWGGHLWRLRLPENRWEHLLTTPEGLIALSCSGRYVYALGYFGHVLYQYDPDTGNHRSVRVGSIGAHVSRNFISDDRDHVFVPRLRKADEPGSPLRATLVEYDTELNELAETPLDNYLDKSQNLVNSHGIIGIQPMRDGNIMFLTSPGMLYRIQPPNAGDREGPAMVESMGFFHPDGSAYVGSLFTYDGRRYLMGVSAKRDWLVYDLVSKTSRAVPMNIRHRNGRKINRHYLLYGSIARDDEGCFYLVGTDQAHEGPIALRLQPPDL